MYVCMYVCMYVRTLHTVTYPMQIVRSYSMYIHTYVHVIATISIHILYKAHET